MQRAWEIIASWEPLNGGNDEENSCFAALGIQAHGHWLTEGRDALANRLRQAPLLSAYHLAEWLAWNWWRLRWEPRSSSEDWAFAHRMSNIGGGYIWPNITIFSDGERTTLIAKATKERLETPFRYISDFAAVIPSMEFEIGIDDFVEQVLGRLSDMGVRDTNLHRIWNDLGIERQTPDLTRIRKLEALLGQEPDESDAGVINHLMADAECLSMAAVEELAADSGHSHGSAVPSAADIVNIAERYGFSASFGDGARIAMPQSKTSRGHIAAWKLGAEAAKSLRQQERISDDLIDNSRLSELLGVDKSALTPGESTHLGISFAMDRGNNGSKVFLRSKWPSGRRFELARLLGDRLMATQGVLYPATRAYTYRQKAQRSFAAELLSPFGAVFNMLNCDYSADNQLEVAEYFQVSELTIRTQLVNHQILEREDLDGDVLALAA